MKLLSDIPGAEVLETAPALSLHDLYRSLKMRGLRLVLRPGSGNGSDGQGSELVLKGPTEQKSGKLLDFIRANRNAIIAILEVHEAERDAELTDLARAAEQEADEMTAVVIAYLVDAANADEVPAWAPGEIEGVPGCPADPNPYIRFLFTYCRMLQRGYSVEWRAKGADAKACAAELTAIAFWFWPGADAVEMAAEAAEVTA